MPSTKNTVDITAIITSYQDSNLVSGFLQKHLNKVLTLFRLIVNMVPQITSTLKKKYYSDSEQHGRATKRGSQIKVRIRPHLSQNLSKPTSKNGK